MTEIDIRERLKIEVGTLLGAGLAIAFLLALPILVQLPARLLLFVLASSLVVSALVIGIKRVVRRVQFAKSTRWQNFGRPLLLTVLLFGALAGLPVYWLALKQEFDPLLLPNVTLSNGQKTVTFQGMVHVGSEGFYKSIVYDLENALANDFKLFYEGIQKSTPEADRWFAEQLSGGESLGDSYKKLASECGLFYQIDYFHPLVVDMRREPERHETADVTTLAMKEEFDRLVSSDPAFAKSVAKNKSATNSFDPMKTLMRWEEGHPKRQALGGVICRGLFTIALNREHTTSDDLMDRVVLDFRNRHLADRIMAESHDKIYVTYGADHLRGLVRELRERDPQWRVETVKWVRPITNPEHFERQLQLD